MTTHHTDWKEEFDEKFSPIDRHYTHTISLMKDFISSLLLSQKEKIIEILEGRKIPLRAPEDHLPNAYQFLKGKNEALSDAIQVIKELE